MIDDVLARVEGLKYVTIGSMEVWWQYMGIETMTYFVMARKK